MSASFLQRVPPPICPIMELLRRLEARAKKGDAQAVLRIREIAKFFRKMNSGLPPKFRQKTSDPSIPSNALAVRLLARVKLIKYGSVFERHPLAIAIKALPALDEESFPEWWKCAWGIATDDILRDEEMEKLIDEIGQNAPSVREQFEKRKKEAMANYGRAMNGLARGIAFENLSANKKAEIFEPLMKAVRMWHRYTGKKTRLAASRVWFG
jgi:hypothetical protein